MTQRLTGFIWSFLGDFISSLPHDKMEAVNAALRIALALGASAADTV
jgi:hypothetical protein